MPVQILLPLATESHDNFNYDTDSDSTVFAVLRNDDLTDEDNHLLGASGAADTPRTDWYVDPITGLAVGVSNVDATWYVRSSGGDEVGLDIDDGSTVDILYEANPGGSPGTYIDKTFTAIDRPTESSPTAWTPEDFNGDSGGGVVMGFYSHDNLAGSVFCTFAKLEVTYTPAGGGFMWLIGRWKKWLEPVAGGGIKAIDLVPAFARQIHRPTMTEMATLAEQLRVRPSYLDLGVA